MTGRLAAIEIGSRAVRLLVAKVTSGQLQPILTRSRETRLMAALFEGGEVLAAQQAAVEIIVAEQIAEAKGCGAERVEVFATEVGRRLLTNGQIDPNSALGRAQILSADEEAVCSALAALTARHTLSMPAGPVLVFDQGGGSVEVIAVQCDPDVRVLGSRTLDLGGDVLLARFQAAGNDLSRFASDLDSAIGAVDLPEASFAAAFAQGSVATKCAWLGSNPPPGSRYDPRRVEGFVLGLQSLDSMVQMFTRFPYRAWDQLRAKFDPANPTSDDMERVVTGAVVLSKLLRRAGINQLRVSSLGTRHGVLLRLANTPAF